MAVVYIGLGANLPGPAGPPEATLAAAAERLAQLGSLVACSSLYSTAPVGFRDQPRFFNAAVELETGLAPRELLDELLNIELEFGRDRSAGLRNGPRALDLDILLYGDLVLSEHNLLVPHPRLAERAFVLVPLCEIAPDVRDPRTASTVGQLLKGLLANPTQGEAHAVQKVESSLWPAGLCGGGSGHA